MAKYRISLERTVRISKWFEAKDDEDAKDKAYLIHLRTDGSEYEEGDSEYDYALCDELGRDLVYWG